MIVMKFGGTSLANSERIKNLTEIIKSRIEKKPIVVVSAVGGITNLLIESAEESSKGINPNSKVEEIIKIHKKIISELNLNEELLLEDFVKLHDILNGVYLIRELSPRSLDLISSFGEMFSSKIVSEYLNSQKINSKQFSGGEIGIITNDEFTNAEILEETYENIKSKLLNLNIIPVITGFIAENKEGEITTLGRGGSDYTASIIGAGINAEEIEIWTDVDGIKTADPRIIPHAKQWESITFNEASEMAYFGAKVLHPKTIRPAINKSIPVRILNTYNLENKGTLVLKETKKETFRAISSKDNINVIRICSTKMLFVYGFLSKVFEIFNKHKISIDLISTSEITISLTLDKINGNSKNLEHALLELENLGKIELLKNRAIICIVGTNIRNTPGVLGKIFNVCKEFDINVEMVSQGASPLSISFVINQEDSEKTIKELHKELFEK